MPIKRVQRGHITSGVKPKPVHKPESKKALPRIVVAPKIKTENTAKPVIAAKPAAVTLVKPEPKIAKTTSARQSSKPVAGEYSAKNITVLEGLEAVRRRPGMYIGSTDVRGMHHLVQEVVDNSVDEALAGVCDRIEIAINPDNSVTVQDNGRGIPVGPHPTQKRADGTPMDALEVVMTILHAGGKFGGGGYKVASGLHGVGVSAVNALSEWLEVEVRRDGKVYRQRYERGRPVTPVESVGKAPAGETGTRTTFSTTLSLTTGTSTRTTFSRT